MVPVPRAVETRLQLPRWIAALFVGIIALASAAALVVPMLQQREFIGQTNVGVITSVVVAPDTAGRVGFAAPDFVWIEPSGASNRLGAQRGRAVVLNFWATWCAPCRAEMPRLEAAARDNSDVTFYEIDLDENGARIRGFFDSLEISHLVPLIDVGSAAARAYGLGSGVPTSFFIDRDGIIRSVSVGEMDVPAIARNLSTVTSAR
ncbi:MAG: TlpA family protein disulfide reductase [Chloroflexota bacterium]|nr:TlpA family protein disulfide reductase [Chloroflexota bacterium]